MRVFCAQFAFSHTEREKKFFLFAIFQATSLLYLRYFFTVRHLVFMASRKCRIRLLATPEGKVGQAWLAYLAFRQPRVPLISIVVFFPSRRLLLPCCRQRRRRRRRRDHASQRTRSKKRRNAKRSKYLIFRLFYFYFAGELPRYALRAHCAVTLHMWLGKVNNTDDKLISR